MKTPNYSKELAAMRKAATAGAGVLSRFARDGFKTSWKGDRDPVTQADIASEKMVKAVLARAFPTYGFLGEEGGQDGSVERRFILDPLDGTMNFSRGVDGYGVILGLEVNGKLVAGVVRRVPHRVELFAREGGGAWRVEGNGKPSRVCASKTKRLVDSIVAVDTPLARYWPTIRPYDRLTNAVRYVPSFDALHEFDLLVQGKIDGLVHPMPKPWDLAGKICILHEAGGRFSNLDGGMRIDAPKLDGCIMSNGALHAELLALFNA